MKNLKYTLVAALLVALVSIPSCKLWKWGETYHYVIEAGEHKDAKCPHIIKETEVWGGEMIMTYNPERMIDTAYNFSYWNKLGGMMPDITDNWIPSKHQSARAAWRINPPVMDSIYLGYIFYKYGVEAPERGYLLTAKGERIAVPLGKPFHVFVSKNKAGWWGISAYYGGKEAYYRAEDPMLRREKFLVVMDPYYGGIPSAPTGINISLKIKDTTWIY